MLPYVHISCELFSRRTKIDFSEVTSDRILLWPQCVQYGQRPLELSVLNTCHFTEKSSIWRIAVLCTFSICYRLVIQRTQSVFQQPRNLNPQWLQLINQSFPSEAGVHTHRHIHTRAKQVSCNAARWLKLGVRDKRGHNKGHNSPWTIGAAVAYKRLSTRLTDVFRWFSTFQLSPFSVLTKASMSFVCLFFLFTAIVLMSWQIRRFYYRETFSHCYQFSTPTTSHMVTVSTDSLKVWVSSWTFTSHISSNDPPSYGILKLNPCVYTLSRLVFPWLFVAVFDSSGDIRNVCST